MSTIRGGLTSFLAGETIPNGRRVKLDSSTPTANTVLLAGATDEDIGVSTLDVSSIAAGKAVPVRLYSEPGTMFVTAAGAVTVNATLFKAASGKVAATGSDVWGRALESAAADADLIEGLRAATQGSGDGLGSLRLARATFNPSANTAERTIAAHTLGVTIPALAVITRFFWQVNTTFTSATDAATVAFHVESAGDLLAAIAISDASNVLDAGIHAGKPGYPNFGADAAHDSQVEVAALFAASAIAVTVDRLITATVAVEALTAGKATLFVEYAPGA